jgi:feruloyl esterase
MRQVTMFSGRHRRSKNFFGLCVLLLTSLAVPTKAADYLDLPVIKPVMACDQLAGADLSKAADAAVVVKLAAVTDTPKGQFCRVTGNIEPSILFEVDLPIDRWTQRFEMNPSNASSIANAGACAPALNGDFAVAFDNLGHSGGGMRDTAWTSNPQLKIDFAYRANHETVLVAKELIKTFYGQPQRFSYFVGCSEGGREALTEAERFPQDFDGVSAGSPVAIDSTHNIFFHPWESYINKRPDGTRILVKDRLGILHAAVMEHCSDTAGSLDNVLLQPTACKFNPAWVQCKPGAADTSNCLTANEIGVVQNLYAGPGDGKGHHFEIAGFAMGTEHRWGLSTADHVANPEAKEGFQMKRLFASPESEKSQSELEDAFVFNQEWYDKTLTLAPLFNAGNTNLRPFQEHGGRLILWNGAQDLTVQPELAVAYYQGVQKVLGEKTTDSFMRLFVVPGVGHCNGGDLAFQLDLLTPLMAWTELHRAPAFIVGGKPVPAQTAAGVGGMGAGGQNGGTGQNAGARAGLAGATGGAWGMHNPFATQFRANEFTRPIFAFPYFAQYKGKGDPNDPASYEQVKSAAPVPQVFDTEAAKLIGPGTQKFYRVESGQLVPDAGSMNTATRSSASTSRAKLEKEK